eukprot:TRINITY_DN40959_c0_g1_i1.p1 TRINITY_DN40959_c0_g1~~TRINITY_DN40959_c0_g1_i1.p1  ORF type:complete len:373 (+),score=94.92 TRINITY_DN40959_c0_g1_i1:101-1219(+)
MAGGDNSFITSLNADMKKARMKKQRREDLLEKTEGGQHILKLHSDLQALADDLDERVENRLATNETAFFLAYKSHMYTVQKEFTELRQRADQEETKTRRDAKIQSLEKELDWFMSEALRLDDLCKKYKKELDKWKGRADALEEDRQFLEQQIMTAKKNNKTLRGAVEKAQTSAYSALVSQEAATVSGTAGGTDHHHVAIADAAGASSEHALVPHDGGSPPALGLSQELEQRYQACVKRLKQQLETERKLAAKMRGVADRQFTEASHLERVFLDAVEQVKAGILDRRIRGAEQDERLRKGDRAYEKARAAKEAAGGKAAPQLSVSAQKVSLEEFTPADRRRVVDMLLSSEQVLQFLYDKLFPPLVDTPEPDGY